MTVHVFRCRERRHFYGHTLSATGDNLPTDQCRAWDFFKTIEIERDSPALLGAEPNEIIAGIEARGYHLITITINFEER